jgi:hypothetical protein
MAKNPSRHPRLSLMIEELNRKLKDLELGGEVIGVLSQSNKTVTWHGLHWPKDDKIFDRLNMSTSGRIHHSDDRPNGFKHGIFVPATEFGFNKKDHFWIALVKIDADSSFSVTHHF